MHDIKIEKCDKTKSRVDSNTFRKPDRAFITKFASWRNN